ncbi:bifunctional demethylmenaquinone methyltransferase/2-methoxy-6-polyprenyl-1,4-benzoquinol methylase UbiE [Sediminibacterium soli]|uniref:bifunctional demethylmenaquinone methyltransferase/2-methoxy-6-polyprenyl-1,4-benzoquinol methylase UbiE n=1 Tax=Sediminibacterium soli TaxID=2698829 RepID=UPI00137A53BB|nr:bifunctional demethylmenaquinone methyltransferase/2-methoxy-6-polyprenyl-1,4-benzoquinol methylase UbiE [Sediminibacterium soli]NCI47504.1 bifunctional demethylmenaquinone methyltransferase/2-methoxy-6-polyprenyl-1,4-benzoquinol methylase UbiE [Sediminibacterium soli]
MTQFAHDGVVPDQESGMKKKEQVAQMFNSIAGRYDFMNRFLTAGVDIRWRKKAISQLADRRPQQVLDVATGTGDIAIMTWEMLHPQHITGIDISEGMLELGRKKIEKLQLGDHITLYKGDSEQIPFGDNSFDAITVSFGVRNFENLERGLSEMLRVLKPGGKLVVLEFSKPAQPFKTFCDIYMNIITPAVGRLFANNRKAYQYLTNSVEAFPEGKEFLSILAKTGYAATYFKRLSLGICTIYCGSKA